VAEFVNPPDSQIRKILSESKTIAVVGLSPKPNRPSHYVAQHLQEFDYRIVPVRPGVKSILGEESFPRLDNIPFNVDLVVIFRAPRFIAGIVDQVIALKINNLWLQEGVIDVLSANRAQQAGIHVVMNRCIYKEYMRLLS